MLRIQRRDGLESGSAPTLAKWRRIWRRVVLLYGECFQSTKVNTKIKIK